MVWYNPSTWFGDDVGEENGVALICSSPQCYDSVIRGNKVAYNKKTGQVYHPDRECIMMSAAHAAWASSEEGTTIVSINYISRRKALRLLEEGRLQPPTPNALEETVQDGDDTVLEE